MVLLRAVGADRARVTSAWMVAALGGCASSQAGETSVSASPSAVAVEVPEGRPLHGLASRCDASLPQHEAGAYDTSGDGIPDVRKVYLIVGDDSARRRVMICRTIDLNHDGVQDLFRYYDDEGGALREDADRNFDGQIDMITAYQDGWVVEREFDDDYNGRIDAKVFYVKDEPVRAERDFAGRSTADTWRPDRWEYFEDGRVVRMGTDLDGDAQVDRWDRLQGFAESPETVDSESGERVLQVP